MMRESWIRKRWFEFRTGHTTYLIFMLTFVNFILIAYRLLIERVPFFNEIIPELWIFVLIFLSIYIPLSIIIGNWHRRSQLKVDQTILMEQNPFNAKLFRILIDFESGKISSEQIQKFRDQLYEIEKKGKFDED